MAGIANLVECEECFSLENAPKVSFFYAKATARLKSDPASQSFVSCWPVAFSSFRLSLLPLFAAASGSSHLSSSKDPSTLVSPMSLYDFETLPLSFSRMSRLFNRYRVRFGQDTCSIRRRLTVLMISSSCLRCSIKSAITFRLEFIFFRKCHYNQDLTRSSFAHRVSI